MYEIFSKLTIKAPERSHWRGSSVFNVNFKPISHFFSSVSIMGFDEVNVC